MNLQPFHENNVSSGSSGRQGCWETWGNEPIRGLVRFSWPIRGQNSHLRAPRPPPVHRISHGRGYSWPAPAPRHSPRQSPRPWHWTFSKCSSEYTQTLTACCSSLEMTFSWGFLFFLPGPLMPAHRPIILRAWSILDAITSLGRHYWPRAHLDGVFGHVLISQIVQSGHWAGGVASPHDFSLSGHHSVPQLLQEHWC